MDPRLEIRRANSDAKCASCGWWGGSANVPAAQCQRHGMKTLDLAVCTDWRDGDPVQEVLPPESQE